jgi:hypothetical protein
MGHARFRVKINQIKSSLGAGVGAEVLGIHFLLQLNQ